MYYNKDFYYIYITISLFIVYCKLLKKYLIFVLFFINEILLIINHFYII